MAEHTPGPWKVVEHIGGGFIIGAYDAAHEGDGVLRLADTVEGRPKGNADLMAAAPELLEACKRFYRVAEGGFLPGPVYISNEERRLLRDAIAKAEGRG